MPTQKPQLPHQLPEYQEATENLDFKDELSDNHPGVEDVDSRPTDVAEGVHDDHKSELNLKWSLLHEVTFVVIICSAQLLTQAGLGQTIFPLHLIGQSFGQQTPGQLSWYIAAYSLTVGTFILIAGRLGDMFGHKLLLLIGFSWFGFWSLIAGLSVYSHAPIFFDICRALQGIGPAILLPNSLAILGRTYPPGTRKEMAFSLFGATAPGGATLGGAFSALIAERSFWPWAYWCMAIVCCLAGGCAFFVIPPSPVRRTSDKSFDFLGSIFGVAGLVLVNVAWNQAPVVGWGTPYVIVLLILGILLLGAFFMVERKASEPLVPFRALSGKAGFVLGCVALGWSSFGIWLLYLLQFVQVLRNVTPLGSAAQFVPTAVVGFLAAVVTGYLLSRMRTSYIMAIAMMAFCVGIILPATMPVEQSYWIQTFLAMVVMVWGMDMSFPAATVLLSNLVSKGQQGVAASLVATVVHYSISIGLGIAGTVESQISEGGKEVLRGYRGAWYAGIGLSGMGVLLSMCFILDERRKTARTSKA